LEKIVSLIQKSQSLILSTHRQCDGDGLGAQLAVYHALKKIGKKVEVVNVDFTPRKYRFLSPDEHILYYEDHPEFTTTADTCLIFDTNDERLVEPLFSNVIRKTCKTIAFIDHHPVLKQGGPQPTAESIIDTTSASTGEMAYRIIKGLGIPLDREIARALYTSITFDTQLYRYIRNSPVSHQIAAELLMFDINPEEVHRHLFGNQTVNKMAFLAKALGQIEYFSEGRLAFLSLKDADLFHYNLEPDESRDVIDMLMNIETLEAAVIFREDAENKYKVSLRSKGKIEVVSIAENIGGGGHNHAAGAFVTGVFAELKDKVVSALTEKLKKI
jgi:phosphoesterase RecJ-like protein